MGSLAFIHTAVSLTKLKMQAECGNISNLKKEALDHKPEDAERNEKAQKGVVQEAMKGGINRITKMKNGKTEEQYIEDKKLWKEKEDKFLKERADKKAAQQEMFIDMYIEQVRNDKINDFRDKLKKQSIKDDPFRRKVCINDSLFKFLVVSFVVGLVLKFTEIVEVPDVLLDNLKGILILIGILGVVIYLMVYTGKKKVEENDELQVQSFVNQMTLEN